MSARLGTHSRSGRLLSAVVAAAALWVAAAAWSPAPAKAVITVFTSANPGEPAGTMTRFTCRYLVDRFGANKGTKYLSATARGGGFSLGLRLPYTRFGASEDIPYGRGGSGLPPFLNMRGPAGAASNFDGGPPGQRLAGSYIVARGRFSVGVIAIGDYAFAGGGTCPKPKRRRR
jgi:hypothetical protein